MTDDLGSYGVICSRSESGELALETVPGSETCDAENHVFDIVKKSCQEKEVIATPPPKEFVLEPGQVIVPACPDFKLAMKLSNTHANCIYPLFYHKIKSCGPGRAFQFTSFMMSHPPVVKGYCTEFTGSYVDTPGAQPIHQAETESILCPSGDYLKCFRPLHDWRPEHVLHGWNGSNVTN